MATATSQLPLEDTVPVVVRAEPIDQLRDDVRLLGGLIGEVLREQGGAQLFADAEHVRTAAIHLRSGTPTEASEAALMAWAEQQSTVRLLQLVRAFSVYFHFTTWPSSTTACARCAGASRRCTNRQALPWQSCATVCRKTRSGKRFGVWRSIPS
jgi:phosphoenolpyruvate carboxylase